MKSLIQLMAGAALLALVASHAWAAEEKIDADKLPPKVKETLKGKFPGAKITSAIKETENNEVIYDVEMTVNGKKHEMDCKEDGTIINFENEIAVKDLPKAVADAVKAKHPDATIKEAMETMVIKDGKDTVDEYELLIVTGDKKEVELTVSPDGKKIE
jgi:hypothetical protein